MLTDLPGLRARLAGPVVRRTSRLAAWWWSRHPIEVEGCRLDPEMQHVVMLIRHAARPLHRMPLETARRVYDTMPQMFGRRVHEHIGVEPLQLAGPAGPLAARLYRPRRAARLPVLVYFHGGGGVVGSLVSHDGICRDLARAADCIVVSVAYRLAPEAPFPAGVDDAQAAFMDVVRRADAFGGDAQRVAVGGDSVGGNLAAVVARRCRDLARRDATSPRPSAQVLAYPVTDALAVTASRRAMGRGFVLDEPLCDWFFRRYVGAGDPRDPDVSPLLAEDFADLAPAIVVTADFDPLRDEGDAYAERLAAAGVPVRHRRVAGLVHGYLQMTGVVPAAHRSLEDIGVALREAFEGGWT